MLTKLTNLQNSPQAFNHCGLGLWGYSVSLVFRVVIISLPSFVMRYSLPILSCGFKHSISPSSSSSATITDVCDMAILDFSRISLIVSGLADLFKTSSVCCRLLPLFTHAYFSQSIFEGRLCGRRRNKAYKKSLQ